MIKLKKCNTDQIALKLLRDCLHNIVHGYTTYITTSLYRENQLKYDLFLSYIKTSTCCKTERTNILNRADRLLDLS